MSEMTSVMERETKEGLNRPKGTPGKALIGFAVLAAVVAGFTIRDYYGRGQLESTHFPTAVGDADYFEAYDEVNRGEEIFRVDGEPYYRLEYNPDERRDDGMKKIAREDEDRFFLYERAVAKESEEDPRYFIKVGEGGMGKSFYLLVGQDVPAAFISPAPVVEDDGADGEGG
ncbi:MAG: hypothetical protein AAGD22_02270 [Verrucomicrobiota bacterium]